MRTTVFEIASWDWSSVVSADPDFATPWWEYVQLVMHLLCDEAWTSGAVSFEAEQVAAERYKKHYEDVRRSVPKEQKLEWHPSEGWRPLCEFLEVKAPFVSSFPKVNDKEEFVAFHRDWFETLKKAKQEMGADIYSAKRCDTLT
jgi:hypothetical protein